MPFRVAEILDDKKIVINAGRRDNIRIGDYFQIQSNHCQNIVDPETGENLGLLNIPKAEVMVSAIWEKMCICITPKRTLSTFIPTYRLPLNVDPSEVSIPELSESELVIHKGDIAIWEKNF